MVDADRIDLVLRPCRRRAESAAGNFLGFIERVFLGDRVRDIDRQEFWLTSRFGSRGDGFGGDLAVERAHRMKVSMAGSRVISVIWLVANWVIATLSGLTPDSVRMTRSNTTFAWVRPMTPTWCPARSSIPFIFGSGFLAPLAGAPEGVHSTTTFLRRMATDSALPGISRSPRAMARSAFEAARSAMLSLAPSVVIGVSRTGLPSRAKVCASA